MEHRTQTDDIHRDRIYLTSSGPSSVFNTYRRPL